jgi:hypothetical protein
MFSTALVWTYKEENDKLVFITHGIMFNEVKLELHEC